MKLKRFTIDSNVFISLLLPVEENHLQSKKMMDFILANEVIITIPFIIVFEVFQSLRRREFFDDNLNFLKFQRIFNSKCFIYMEINYKLFKFFSEFNFFWSLKTSDAIIATSAMISNSMLITWDKSLLNKAHNAYTPTQFLSKFAR